MEKEGKDEKALRIKVLNQRKEKEKRPFREVLHSFCKCHRHKHYCDV